MPVVRGRKAQAVKRMPLNAEIQGVVHAVVRRDHQPEYRRTLCLWVLENCRPYTWSESHVTCIECAAEDSYAQGR